MVSNLLHSQLRSNGKPIYSSEWCRESSCSVEDNPLRAEKALWISAPLREQLYMGMACWSCPYSHAVGETIYRNAGKMNCSFK